MRKSCPPEVRAVLGRAFGRGFCECARHPINIVAVACGGSMHMQAPAPAPKEEEKEEEPVISS